MFIDVRLFLQRAGVALLLIIFAALVCFPVYGLFDAVTVEWYLGVLSFSLVVHYPVVVLLRFGMLALADANPFKKRILIIGEGEMAGNIRGFISGQGTHTHALVGTFGETELSDLFGNDNAVAPDNYPTRDSKLLKYAAEKGIDEIVVATQEKRGLPVWHLLECRMAGLEVVDYLTFWEREAGQIDLDEVRPTWLTMADGFVVDRTREVVKRGFDIIVSTLILTLTLPVTLLTALLVKIDSTGPVFYRQERVGKYGRTFDILKFRSMCNDAEKEGVPQWAQSGDARVTRVGQFIRKTRIDELPQVINVLKGDMSFVGPRPERPFFVENLQDEIPLYGVRHNVKPGITGWAQANYPYGASVEDARKKLAYDLYYVKNSSLFLDIVVLLQTVRVVVMLAGSR